MWPRVDGMRSIELPRELAEAEGEGDPGLASWRDGHRRYRAAAGTPVDDGSAVACLRFQVV